MNYSLRYQRNKHEKQWVVNNVSWITLEMHLKEIMKNTTEKELFIIIKKEAKA